MSIFDKIVGSTNSRVLAGLRRRVDEINAFEEEIKKLSDEELCQKTADFKVKIAKAGDNLAEEDRIVDQILSEAFAVMREAMRRVWGERHFDVQLIGGIVLHQGKIAEMKTGEGKTIVAALPLYLNALRGRGVHLVTVNDYLSRNHGEGMGQVYDFLGLSCGIIQSNQLSYRFVKKVDYKHYSEADAGNLEVCTRKEAYACDITYGTNNEYGFDYMRDNMAYRLDDCVQRSLFYAIVDEVDSILIDEARTPLIISAAAEESTSLYQQFAALVPRLVVDEDYTIDEKERVTTLTDAGVHKMEKMLGIKNIYDANGIVMVHHLEEALKAHTLFKKDRDYLVKEGEIIIVDEFTGRLMVGRRYSEGLHQAIEAKEGVEVKQESQTLATISFQNFFRLYEKLAGMTGTAATEAEEFYKIYKLDVVEIPTHRAVVRQDSSDKIFKTEVAKIESVVAEVKAAQEAGQPVLIGTVSVEKNEVLSKMLSKAGVKHEVLNAKNHEREAKIIVKAGQKGAVTVATNMAGRGTDIKLGPGVVELGGLFVIGTERHEARRIDNQLRGRAGRQGDPGKSLFYVSLEDDLMRIFGGERIKNLMNTLGLPDDMPIENRMISRSIESAQRKVEGHNFDIRKHLVEYDDVLNKHREVIYRLRQEILAQAEGKPLPKRKNQEQDTEIPETIKQRVLEIVDTEIETIVMTAPDQEKAKAELSAIFGEIKLPSFEVEELRAFSRQLYEGKERQHGQTVMNDVGKAIFLRTIDMLWVEHLTTIDELRTGIGLRGYGQRDPLVEYKQEAYRLFHDLLASINSSVARTIYKVEVQVQAPVQPAPQLNYEAPNPDAIGGVINELTEIEKTVVEEKSSNNGVTTTIRSSKGLPPEATVPGASGKTVYDRMTESAGKTGTVKAGKKVGRNDPCPCGSGKKYKKCHGK